MVAKFQFIALLLQRCFVWSKNDHTHQAIYQRMTVKLQELAIKSELKVAMRYENSKTVALRCKNRCYVKFKNLSYKARVTKDCVTLSQSF